MRFNKRNWVKFFDGSNKKTTLRLRKSPIGHHKAYAGSYFKPILLGEFDIVKITQIEFKNLDEEDAKLDGFNSLPELINELTILNGKIEPETILYQHWIENAKKQEVLP